MSEWLLAKPLPPYPDGRPYKGFGHADIKDRANGHSLLHSSQLSYDSHGALIGSTLADTDTWYQFEWMNGFTHPGWRYRYRYPRWDLGGNWEKYDILVSTIPTALTAIFYPLGTSSQARNVWSGNLTANPDTASILAHVLNPDVSMNYSYFTGKCPSKIGVISANALGATAISLVKPTNPAFELTTAIGELLRDGLPSLPGRGNGNVGEEYLNLQFAWAPTISDGKGFLRAIREQDALNQQYVRDSGRLVRRRYEFPLTQTSSATVTSNASPGVLGVAPTGQQVRQGTRKVFTTTQTRIWFSGAFTYHLPENVFGRTIAELDHTYGVRPDLESLWNLTPWSWLVDWFSNAGQVLSNLDSFVLDGLVMPWGYIMRDVTTITETLWEGEYRREQNVWSPLVLRDRVVTRTRQRQQASPFGFGFTWDGFSPFQLSILAALGISRV